MRHQSQESQMNCDAMILRRAASVLDRQKPPRRQPGLYRFVSKRLIEAAQRIEIVEGTEYVNDSTSSSINRPGR